MATPSRPERTILPDFAGRPFTVSSTSEAWECLAEPAGSRTLLLLGIGPGDAWDLPLIRKTLSEGKKVFWMESENTLKLYKNLPAFEPPPENSRKMAWSDICETVPDCSIYFHKPARRLDPDFWIPLLGRINARSAAPIHSAERQGPPRVWLPGNERMLLWQELSDSFTEMGFLVESREDWNTPENFRKGDLPDFALSINFRGLDSDGRIFGLFQALGIPLAIWLVDNPWHLLSSIRLPWWKQANLFLTDPSFIDELQAYGAEHAHFCSLAASGHMWRGPAPNPVRPPLFVGRSAFPDRGRFFSGLKMPGRFSEEAMRLVDSHAKERPDCHWWQKRLNQSLWPDREGRLPGYCADLCSMRNRALWLARVTSAMEIVGDDGWKSLLPGRNILPPADYYGPLADMYNASQAVLNVTSWLLPASLNQRHFDVWAAGGLLLSDDSPGLKLFPEELVEPVRLTRPEEFGERLAWFNAHSGRKEDLVMAWRECIKNEHSYRHRLEDIMRKAGVTIR